MKVLTADLPAYSRAYYQANKEKLKRRRRERYAANSGRERAQKAAWYQANSEIAKERRKLRPSKKHIETTTAATPERKKQDPAVRKAYKRAWYLANRERYLAGRVGGGKRERNLAKAKERDRAWARANPDRVAAKINRYRARKRNGLCTKADLKSLAPFYAQAQRASKCVGVEFHVDHIVPLSKGGEHRASNLRVLPASLNRRKGACLPDELPENLKIILNEIAPAVSLKQTPIYSNGI